MKPSGNFRSVSLFITSITFEGEVEEWNAITKKGGWNNNVPATKVVCKDGEEAL